MFQRQSSQPGAVEILLRELPLPVCWPVTDICSERLRRAVEKEDVSVIRELHQSGSESLQDTLQAIVRIDNDQLLNSTLENIEVTDGTIRDKGIPINTSVLSYAVKRSALRCVSVLMQAGVSITDYVREPLLTVAVEKNDVEMMSNLLAETNQKEDELCALLAAKKGHAEVLDIILWHKIQARTAKKEATGDSLLHVTARSAGPGSVDCLKILLEKYNLDIEATNDAGRTPLQEAADAKRTENAGYLISRGAELNSSTDVERSLLTSIAQNVPRAMEEFRKRLDEGITLDRDRAVISLDHDKIFKRDQMEENITDMSLFLSLSDSPFEDIIEHPLCQTFLCSKFKKVTLFFVIAMMLPHFLFSVIFSVYCGILFGYLCVPEDKDFEDRFNLSSNIACSKQKDHTSIVYEAHIAWILLIFSLVIYIVKEIISLAIQQRKQRYFYNWETYKNLATITAIVLVVYQGSPMMETNLTLQRWQYHVAALTCLAIWLEMLMLVGQIPKYGKYIHMFKSVSMKMIQFFAAYIWLAIGFMMMFIILFSNERSMRIGNFPGALVNIKAMMLGEINYLDLYYGSNQKLNTSTGDISEEYVYNNFPGTAHLTLIVFIPIFCLVIMNLLVGLAVFDIHLLLKSGKREQLKARVELISSVENFEKTKLFSLLPSTLQTTMKRLVDSRLVCSQGTNCWQKHMCCHQVEVKYSDINDKHFPETLKKILYTFCLRKEKEKKKIRKEKERNDIKAELLEIKQMLAKLTSETGV